MPSIALTGGIACGKSTALSFLTKTIPGASYSSDQAVDLLLKNDPEVKQELTTTFGPQLYCDKGNIDKDQLRALLVEKPASKKKLEAILHPRLQRQWQPQAERALGDSTLFFIAEIPLLYEIPKLLAYFDRVIVVASSPQIQLERLKHQRHLPQQVATALLQLQLPLNEKIARSDYLLWNDGSASLFEAQLSMLASLILNFKK